MQLGTKWVEDTTGHCKGAAEQSHYDENGRFGNFGILVPLEASPEGWLGDDTGGEDLREIRRRQQDHLRVQPQGRLTRHRRLV